jgi:hypothetical protein
MEKPVVKKSLPVTALVLIIVITITVVMPVVVYADTSGQQKQVTTGQKNIVLRARQVYEIEWTPVRDVYMWDRNNDRIVRENNYGDEENGENESDVDEVRSVYVSISDFDMTKNAVFKAGVTVQGLPYGMPRTANYVPLGTSFSQFLAEVENSGSRFYTSFAARYRISPYYSLDCSAFVTWAWGLESLHKTWDLPDVSTDIGNDLNLVELGDALNLSGLHVVLVTEVEYDDGEISAIGIMELYPPKATYTLYGQGGTRPLQDVMRLYLDRGYTILRYNNRENVEYIHDCAIALDGDYCRLCFNRQIKFTIFSFGRAVTPKHWRR